MGEGTVRVIRECVSERGFTLRGFTLKGIKGVRYLDDKNRFPFSTITYILVTRNQ
jgi:hypothetical protein